jgi:carbon starvation protein
MYLTVIYGDVGVLHAINMTMAEWSAWTWVVLLLLYSYVASVLPVWVLLQPRDYINSLQLISALGLIVIGLAWAAFAGGSPLPDGTRPSLQLAAPVVNWSPQGAPLIFPFLFITIACGAISGFHCLVSSGTSSKQLQSEPDARFVGYGGMLLEGFLAVLVILACAAGLGLGLNVADGSVLAGQEAWASRYAVRSSKLGPLVAAVVDGSANFL